MTDLITTPKSTLRRNLYSLTDLITTPKFYTFTYNVCSTTPKFYTLTYNVCRCSPLPAQFAYTEHLQLYRRRPLPAHFRQEYKCPRVLLPDLPAGVQVAFKELVLREAWTQSLFTNSRHGRLHRPPGGIHGACAQLKCQSKDPICPPPLSLSLPSLSPTCSHALMANLLARADGSTRLFAMHSRNCKARTHSPAFSQALQAALYNT